MNNNNRSGFAVRLIPLLALTAAVLCCGEGAAAPRVFRATVVGVQDGDTLTVLDSARTRHRIRLAGVDAPEWRQPFDEASKGHLIRLVKGREVEVRVTKRDRYDRFVAKVVLGGRDICLEQLRAGLAWFYSDYQEELSAADRRAYSAAARDARGARRGLWADSAPVPPWQFRRGLRSGSAGSGTQAGPAAGKIIANVRSGLYHLPSCPGWGEVAARNRRYFESEAAAVAAGFRRAGNCR